MSTSSSKTQRNVEYLEIEGVSLHNAARYGELDVSDHKIVLLVGIFVVLLIKLKQWHSKGGK